MSKFPQRNKSQVFNGEKKKKKTTLNRKMWNLWELNIPRSVPYYIEYFS